MYQYFEIIESNVDVHEGFICVFLEISQRFFSWLLATVLVDF